MKEGEYWTIETPQEIIHPGCNKLSVWNNIELDKTENPVIVRRIFTAVSYAWRAYKMSKLDFIERIVQPQDAPDVGVKVRVGTPVPVMLAPEGDAKWGFYMFPTVWKLRDSRLVCAVTIGNDEMPSHADYHYMWYISDDGGTHWTHAVLTLKEAESFMRERQTLPNGRQIYFEPTMISLDSIPVKPFDLTPEEIKMGCQVYYRLGDIPEELRYIRMFSRDAGQNEWFEDRATMDPDIIVPAFMEPVIENDPALEPTHSAIATRLRKLFRYIGDKRLPSLGKEDPPTRLGKSFRDIHINRMGMSIHYASTGLSPSDLYSSHPENIVMRLLLPSPTSARLHDQSYRPLIGMPDGRLFATSFGSHPAQSLRVVKRERNLDTYYYPNIFESTDQGRYWSYYSHVPYYRMGKYTLYQAHITPNMPKGNWICAGRADSLMLTRSYDDGLTWEKPEIIREHGVNPAGGLLKNGIAFRMYGRPGQFITFCSDGEGKKWGNDIVLVQGMGDPAIEQNRNTCANSCTYVVGPNSFIVVYTDYTYRHKGAGSRPAVLACEVTAKP